VSALGQDARDGEAIREREGSFLRAIKSDLSILRGNFLVLLVTWIIFRVAFRMVGFYESLYVRALGASPTMLGLMNGIYMAVFSLSLIPGSYVADRWGRRRIIILMTYCLGASYIFYVLAPDWHLTPPWQLILIGMVMAAASRVYSPALQAITADSLPPERRGLGYALSSVVPDTFAIASPLLAAFLISRYGFVKGMRLAYLAVFLSFMAAATIRLFFLRETVRPQPGAPWPGLATVYVRSVKDMVSAVREAGRELKTMVLISLIISPMAQALWIFTPLYVVDHAGITEEGWGTISSIRIAFSLAAGLLLGKLADVASRKKMLVASYVARAAFTLALPFARGFTQVLAILLLLDLAATAGMPAIQALLADLTPRAMRGRIYGARLLLANLSSALVLPAMGVIYGGARPEALFFIASPSSLIAGLLVAALVREPLRREA